MSSFVALEAVDMKEVARYVFRLVNAVQLPMINLLRNIRYNACLSCSNGSSRNISSSLRPSKQEFQGLGSSRALKQYFQGVEHEETAKSYDSKKGLNDSRAPCAAHACALARAEKDSCAPVRLERGSHGSCS